MAPKSPFHLKEFYDSVILKRKPQKQQRWHLPCQLPLSSKLEYFLAVQPRMLRLSSFPNTKAQASRKRMKGLEGAGQLKLSKTTKMKGCKAYSKKELFCLAAQLYLPWKKLGSLKGLHRQHSHFEMCCSWPCIALHQNHSICKQL